MQESPKHFFYIFFLGLAGENIWAKDLSPPPPKLILYAYADAQHLSKSI